MSIEEHIEQTEKIFEDDRLSWETKFNVIFKLKVGDRIKELGIDFYWVDPDCGYREDVTAYVQAVRDIKAEAIALDELLSG